MFLLWLRLAVQRNVLFTMISKHCILSNKKWKNLHAFMFYT
jgi:hypothetical protein